MGYKGFWLSTGPILGIREPTPLLVTWTGIKSQLSLNNPCQIGPVSLELRALEGQKTFPYTCNGTSKISLSNLHGNEDRHKISD